MPPPSAHSGPLLKVSCGLYREFMVVIHWMECTCKYFNRGLLNSYTTTTHTHTKKLKVHVTFGGTIISASASSWDQAPPATTDVFDVVILIFSHETRKAPRFREKTDFFTKYIY